MMIGSRRLVSAITILCAAWMTPAGAQLNMQFEGNHSRVCMNSTSGFDANLALLGTGFVSSNLDKRVITFNPDGTGTATVKSIGIGHSATTAGSTPASESESSCTFTYTLDPATRVVTTSSTCDFTVLTGPAAGQTGQITNSKGEAVILQSGNILVSQATTPNVEISTNLTTGIVTQRICTRTGTAFRKR